VRINYVGSSSLRISNLRYFCQRLFLTLVPWIKGQPLVCDITVVDTLADSYVLKTSEVSGFAAEMACKRKHSKCSSIISSNYIFKGLAFETLGPWFK
jgi:hypothetical protein